MGIFKIDVPMELNSICLNNFEKLQSSQRNLDICKNTLPMVTMGVDPSLVVEPAPMGVQRELSWE